MVALMTMMMIATTTIKNVVMVTTKALFFTRDVH